MFALPKNILSFEQQNKQLCSDHENSKCPPPTVTHAFNLLGRFLTALSTASSPDHLQCMFVFLNDGFHLIGKKVNKYD